MVAACSPIEGALDLRAADPTEIIEKSRLGANMWRFPIYEDEVYRRNPLASVVCQLRFHPILKIRDRVADFQEQVRDLFPGFAKATVSVLDVQAEAASVDVQKEDQFLFKKTDGSSTLTLTTSSLAIENHAHIDRHRLFADIVKSVRALHDVYKPLSPARLGLRYVNIIDKEQISRDLGRDLQWNELISSAFLRMPENLADLDHTIFHSEIRSPTQNKGELTLRFGLLPHPDGRTKFRFDMDRYVVGDFDLFSIESMLSAFGEELFGLFRTAVESGLQEWMNG